MQSFTPLQAHPLFSRRKLNYLPAFSYLLWTTSPSQLQMFRLTRLWWSLWTNWTRTRCWILPSLQRASPCSFRFMKNLRPRWLMVTAPSNFSAGTVDRPIPIGALVRFPSMSHYLVAQLRIVQALRASLEPTRGGAVGAKSAKRCESDSGVKLATCWLRKRKGKTGWWKWSRKTCLLTTIK